jgi:hypothetical protein
MTIPAMKKPAEPIRFPFCQSPKHSAMPDDNKMPWRFGKRCDRKHLRKTILTFLAPRSAYMRRSRRKTNQFIVAAKNEVSENGGAVNGLRTLESTLE